MGAPPWGNSHGAGVWLLPGAPMGGDDMGVTAVGGAGVCRPWGGAEPKGGGGAVRTGGGGDVRTGGGGAERTGGGGAERCAASINCLGGPTNVDSLSPTVFTGGGRRGGRRLGGTMDPKAYLGNARWGMGILAWNLHKMNPGVPDRVRAKPLPGHPPPRTAPRRLGILVLPAPPMALGPHPTAVPY
jgi:hypothetical protein